MAATIIKRAATASKLLESLACSPCQPSASGVVSSSVVARRFVNTNALRDLVEDDTDDGHLDAEDNRATFVSPRRRANDPFSSFRDVFDPFNPTRSLSQVMNLMDQVTSNPFLAGATTPSSLGVTGGFRRGWDVREDANALYLQVDMPGLGKEHVKMWAEKDTLVIKGEGEKEEGPFPVSPEGGEDGGNRRKYSSRIELPSESFSMDKIKAEMKNGLLKVVVPKIESDERKDMFQVQIE